MTTLLITARDPLTAGDGAYPARTARDLARSGEPVTLVLLEDAVTLARLGHRDVEHLVGALDAGVEVLVEDDARRRRAVDPIDGVKPTTFVEVVDRLIADRSAWL
jgi:hypothetical protein